MKTILEACLTICMWSFGVVGGVVVLGMLVQSFEKNAETLTACLQLVAYVSILILLHLFKGYINRRYNSAKKGVKIIVGLICFVLFAGAAYLLYIGWIAFVGIAAIIVGLIAYSGYTSRNTSSGFSDSDIDTIRRNLSDINNKMRY